MLAIQILVLGAVLIFMARRDGWWEIVVTLIGVTIFLFRSRFDWSYPAAFVGYGLIVAALYALRRYQKKNPLPPKPRPKWRRR